MKKINIAVYGIDDNKDDLEFIKRTLEKIGYLNYELFTNPSDFMELLDGIDDNIHVCIVDENLQGHGMKGLDIVKAVKEKNKYTIVIAYTAAETPSVYEDYIDYHVYGWVNKNRSGHLDKLAKLIAEGVESAKINVEIYEWTKNQLKNTG